jgi:hypothetical protein
MQARNSLLFMEPEGSLLCLQEDVTSPYPKTDNLLHTPKPDYPFILILFSHLCLGPSSGSFDSSLKAFQPKYCMHFSVSPKTVVNRTVKLV